MVCLLRKPSKTEARKQPVKVRKWTNLKNILRISPSTSWIFQILPLYLCHQVKSVTIKTQLLWQRKFITSFVDGSVAAY